MTIPSLIRQFIRQILKLQEVQILEMLTSSTAVLVNYLPGKSDLINLGDVTHLSEASPLCPLGGDESRSELCVVPRTQMEIGADAQQLLVWTLKEETIDQEFDKPFRFRFDLFLYLSFFSFIRRSRTQFLHRHLTTQTQEPLDFTLNHRTTQPHRINISSSCLASLETTALRGFNQIISRSSACGCLLFESSKAYVYVSFAAAIKFRTDFFR